MKDKLNIVFAGTPDIAATVLANILKHNFHVSLVLTQPDRPSGRGMKLAASPVKELASQHGIEVFQPESFKKNPNSLDKIRNIQPDIVVVVAYGLLLPQEFLDIPRLGCVNIHVSLLPRWRGAAPIHRAILAGDEKTGVCIMQMDAGLDTGDILLLETVVIDKKETTLSLHNKLAESGATKIVEFLSNIEAYKPQVQSTEGVCYAHKIEKEEAKIDWSEDAHTIERKIRGFNPFPGAFSFYNGVLHKFWAATVMDVKRHDLAVGKILDNKDELWIVCGNGTVLQIDEIQEAGSKRKPIELYLQGKQSMANGIFGA